MLIRFQQLKTLKFASREFGKMSYGNKRIKPDPDLLEPIEKTNEGHDIFEEMSVEPCDKDIELEAANCS
ncbi:unnamed protein product [Acanthoscelides obtectus]|uniref:Uncharacterized protein n=1 Tax=Acanthoscelides obtectus TaxID=200917 RepID=A0A9P0PR68_ACAOB|nr:unnamed protein product [Acanthoscelides obtectus]CAK1626580.1 hypothetical protein AOBTE_LOCUS3949 [Acanthoscelides obtectus]